MQNFKDGKVPVSDNKLVSLRKYALTALHSKYSGEELNNIVNWILEHFTGINSSKFNDSDLLVNQSSIIHFCNAVDRLLAGIPVQYIIGEVEFYGLKLKVNSSVLIPRPETEELVDLIVKENNNQKGLKILDIGTGSGCIALSLTKKLAGSTLIAVDISNQALDTAAKNAQLNHLANVKFLESDILNEDCFFESEFDIIVSNPPYIAASESSGMHANVLDHEPSLALFVPDNDPLVFYRKIVELSGKYLKPQGIIYLEINERLGKETIELFNSNSFSSIHLINDMFSKNRFVKAVKL